MTQLKSWFGGPAWLRAVALVWAGGTAVQAVIWLLICVLGGGLDGPWWLWWTVCGGLIVAVLRLLAHRATADRTSL
ncbi:hypothetical protein LWP59_32355 [Amycolatopsis acidiphila]|uniref:DUF2530 domain-containing protein n=1 Tax=Amycolatopsis acidiphila TaxID=715473 RepID=A0A558A6G3_9PSEU|nr:hypothetical protein [Amycolatopsis acidiphila]TVT19836.1 hypothetical protein FNH06_22700 [Amycolatopsis acidiphila]UIJ58742.1 hypothetical protein LWP59_32355 [Amycolatopsis acidiphila]GHG71672.1 hypothetical protein GCM10017788_33530 [Amycolatopsis acidiphila]